MVLCGKKLTEKDQRVLLNVFKDPTATKGFLEFLSELSERCEKEFQVASNTYLVNGVSATKAMALQLKGKKDFVEEFSQIISQANK